MALAPRRLGRQVTRGAPWALVAVTATAVAAGWIRIGGLGLFPALLLIALLAAVGAMGFRAFKAEAMGRPMAPREEAELGALLVLAGFVVARPDGLDSPVALFPVVYLVMAFLVSFLSQPVGIGLTAGAIALDVASFAAQGRLSDHTGTIVAHAAFLAIFAGLYRVVLAAQVAGGRAREILALKERQREVDDRAREYRLVAGESGPAHDEGRWLNAAVNEVKEAIGNTLEVAACALKPHTVAAYLLRDDRVLRLQD